MANKLDLITSFVSVLHAVCANIYILYTCIKMLVSITIINSIGESYENMF